jgi:4-amino-4-deoxy-L-arabinose transferase and related glycosyltransferases of PMT family
MTMGEYIRKGELYSIKIAGSKKDRITFAAIYTMDEGDAALGSQMLYLDGKLVEGQAVCAYIYEFPLNWKNVLCIWMFIGIIGLMLTEVLTGDIFIKENRLFEFAEELLNRYQIVILLIELVLIFLLVIRIARNEAVDWDESFTWNIVTKNNFSGMLRATASDVHPPLYYALVMASMKIFGENIFVAKMVSVAGGFATAVLGITLVRKRWGVKRRFHFC